MKEKLQFTSNSKSILTTNHKIQKSDKGVFNIEIISIKMDIINQNCELFDLNRHKIKPRAPITSFITYNIINNIIHINASPKKQISCIVIKINQLPTMEPMQIIDIPYRDGVIRYNKLVVCPYDKDIIPGVYEGGCKVWQCTIDLLKFMSDTKIDVNGKNVMDIGCGHGLLGIAALKNDAKCCYFQDYNKVVLDSITTATITLNNLPLSNCKFIFGDWDTMNQKQIDIKFDLILGAEIIYTEENYEKLVRLCKKFLHSQGRAVFANKHYYFGVGGNMDDFKEMIEKGGLVYQSYLKIVPPKGGNKKQIIGVYLPKNSTNQNV